MEISKIQPNTGKIEVQGEVTVIGAPRSFNKFGKEGRVATARLRDSSGEVNLSLWNEQIDQVKQGDNVKILNGWAAEYQGEIQLSTGKFGTLEIVKTGGTQGNSSTEVDEEDLESNY